MTHDFCFLVETDMGLAAAIFKWFVIFFGLSKSSVRVLVSLKFQGEISYTIVLAVEDTKKKNLYLQGQNLTCYRCKQNPVS